MSGLSSLHRAAFTLVASALVPTMLAAQATTRPTFGVSGGVAFPTGDFGDAVSTGYDIAAHIGYKPALSPVGLRVEGMFNQFDLKGTGTDFKAKILAGTANLVIMSSAAPGSMRPYFIGGAGVYNLKLSSSSLNASSNSETKFGLNGGAGLDLALSGINVFAEARYHHVFSKDDATGANNTGFVPLVVGVRF
jgi:opacity protein-like surface antigen